MRAVEITGYGAPDVLRLVERPVPEAGEGELRIRVAASGVNRPDVLQRLGHRPLSEAEHVGRTDGRNLHSTHQAFGHKSQLFKAI